MNNKYPILNPNFQLHITAHDCTLFYIIRNKTAKIGLEKYKQWKINPLMAQYLSYCDGQTTHGEILNKINFPFFILIDNGVKYLEEETNVITLKDKSEDCKKHLFVTGSFNSYNPLHASIEVTDYCNFRCKHCYVSASPEKLKKRNYEDMISLMDLLYSKGVKVIELTGGECTTHPQFKEILDYACNKFNLVAIMTNGYILGQNEELCRFIGGFKNVAIQVSLDGLKQYHDYFRNKDGAFDNAIMAIKNLKKFNCIVRVGTTITYDNINDIDDIFKLCKELNVDSFATTTVSSFGRGRFGCDNSDKELKSMLVEKLAKYQDDKLFEANYLTLKHAKENKDINCGAGWRTFAINGGSGDVRSCLFLNNESVIGNLDKDEYEDIFSKKKLDSFRNAYAPSIYLDTCKDCKYKERCNGCMAKAIETCKNHNPECKWVKKYNIKI